LHPLCKVSLLPAEIVQLGGGILEGLPLPEVGIRVSFLVVQYVIN
jgi:hypothetical protein